MLRGIPAALLALFSWVSPSWAAAETHAQNIKDPTPLLERFRKDLGSTHLSAPVCLSLLKPYVGTFDFSAAELDPALTSEQTDRLLEQAFLARLELRSKLKPQSPTICADLARALLRELRLLDEYVAGWKHPAFPARQAFSGSYPTLLLPPDRRTLEFHSGDIIISRSRTPLSSAIATVGDIAGQFSHVALLHIDEKTGAKQVIEADMEAGTKIVPFEDFLRDGKTRALVFRHPDASLAQRAANGMMARLLDARARGQVIPYDFGMVFDDGTELSCSEVPYEAYRQASAGALRMGPFKTRLGMRNRGFLNAIGIQAREVFLPSDLELDSRFELAAEWRDLAWAAQTRYLDAITSQIYFRMEQENYALTNTVWQKAGMTGIWVLRRTPLLARLVEDRLAPNMPLAALGLKLSLDDLGRSLSNQLKLEDDAHWNETGLRMTFKDVQEAVRRIFHK